MFEVTSYLNVILDSRIVKKKVYFIVYTSHISLTGNPNSICEKNSLDRRPKIEIPDTTRTKFLAANL